jgi:hypothetical protein
MTLRFSEEQIIGILKEHEAGVSVAEKDHSVERPSGALQRGAVVILAIAFGGRRPSPLPE